MEFIPCYYYYYSENCFFLCTLAHDCARCSIHFGDRFKVAGYSFPSVDNVLKNQLSPFAVDEKIEVWSSGHGMAWQSFAFNTKLSCGNLVKQFLRDSLRKPSIDFFLHFRIFFLGLGPPLSKFQQLFLAISKLWCRKLKVIVHFWYWRCHTNLIT